MVKLPQVSYSVTRSARCSQRAPPRYFLKFENFLPHSEYPDVDHTLRGTGGPVKVGYNSHITEASKAFIKACVGVGIPFTHDFNGPLSTLGVSRVSFLSTRLSEDLPDAIL